MNNAAKLFATPTTKSTVRNASGYPAHQVSLKEDYVQMVMTNTVGNTYYAGSKELFDKSMDLHKQMLQADPAFMAKTAIYGRNASLMRLQPIIATAFLSTATSKAYFKAAFQRVVKTPGDLIDFVTIVGNIRNGRGLGRTVKREINNFLNRIDQYRVIKYGGGKDEGWTLRDIARATHPVPVDGLRKDLFSYIVNGTYTRLDQVDCVEQLKTLSPKDENYTQKVIDLINKGRLPYEIVTGIVKPNAEIWEHLMKQMPIFALTRNLNTLHKAGVFSKAANVNYVIDQLTNPDIIQNSRMLPFRFNTAYEQYVGDVNIKTALAKALDLSLANAQVIEGVTEWFLDVSGSMGQEYLTIGGILALAGLKQSPQSEFLAFESALHYPQVDRANSTMKNLEIVKRVARGGTATHLCIDHLLGKVGSAAVQRGYFSLSAGYGADVPAEVRRTTPKMVDNIVIVTDEQQNSGTPVISKFREYRRTVNPDAKLFIIDIAPLSGRMANDKEPGVTFIYGWSEAVLDILRFAIEGNMKHVELIDSMSLN